MLGSGYNMKKIGCIVHIEQWMADRKTGYDVQLSR